MATTTTTTATVSGRRTAARGSRGSWAIIVAVLAVALLVGLPWLFARRRSTFRDDYGFSSGARGTSVNGTSVLAGLFRVRGHRVRSLGRLSPVLNSSDVIVWAPNDFAPPRAAERVFLENWLRQRPRTLIYVGRDFDASISYWQWMTSVAGKGESEETQRQLARAIAAHEVSRQALPQGTDADWFQVERDLPRRAVQSVDSTDPAWSQDLAGDGWDLEIGARLVPLPETRRDGSLGPSVQVLLASEGEALVTRLSHPRWGQSKMVVVTNGSMLLNLPLVHPRNRQLAERLVGLCPHSGSSVTFLENGPDGLLVRTASQAADYRNGFELFTVWPTNVISLHLAALGIVAVFMFMPIFGRPRDPMESSPADFGRHVLALGGIFQRTGDLAFAHERLRYYHQQVRRDQPVSDPVAVTGGRALSPGTGPSTSSASLAPTRSPDPPQPQPPRTL